MKRGGLILDLYLCATFMRFLMTSLYRIYFDTYFEIGIRRSRSWKSHTTGYLDPCGCPKLRERERCLSLFYH